MTLSELLGVVKNAIKQSIFKVEGRVDVGFPEVQKVEIVNPSEPTETVEVSNLPALEEAFSKVVLELSNNLVTSLEALQKAIPEDKTSKITEKIEKLGKSLGKDLDLSKVIKGLSDIKKGIDEIEIPKNEVDLKPILTEIKKLGELIPDLSAYAKYDEFKVILNEKQFDKLVKALNVSVALSGGGTSPSTTQTVTGSITALKNLASTSTLTNVSGSTSSVTLASANTARLGLHVVNDSTATLYMKWGSSASTTSYTILLFPYMQYEMADPVYTGIVTGIWSSATGAARITEETI